MTTFVSSVYMEKFCDRLQPVEALANTAAFPERIRLALIPHAVRTAQNRKTLFRGKKHYTSLLCTRIKLGHAGILPCVLACRHCLFTEVKPRCLIRR